MKKEILSVEDMIPKKYGTPTKHSVEEYVPSKKPLYYLNYYFLQFFGVRLCRVVDESTKKQKGWAWMTRIIPLTGWNTPYRKF
jgi:cyanate lyase